MDSRRQHYPASTVPASTTSSAARRYLRSSSSQSCDDSFCRTIPPPAADAEPPPPTLARQRRSHRNRLLSAGCLRRRSVSPRPEADRLLAVSPDVAAVVSRDTPEVPSDATEIGPSNQRFLINRTIGLFGQLQSLSRKSNESQEKTETSDLEKPTLTQLVGPTCSIGSAPMPTFRKDSFRWLLPKVSQRRLVCKNGDCNISRINIDKRGRRYLADIFTTLVDIKWRWNLCVFTMAFTLSWLIFALLWWLIAFSHRDLENYGHEGWKPCVEEVYDFPTALLFSIETQQTIGYGTRCMNPNCPHAIFLVMAQSCFGIIIQALMTGLVFAKLSRPKKRAQTLMFSKSAVICPRDGDLYMLFRVGDMRKSHIVEAQVRAIIVSKRVTEEGEVLPLYQRELQLGGDGDATTDGRLFLVWPVIVQHRIDADSPLWDVNADDLQLRGGGGLSGSGNKELGTAPPPGFRVGHHFEILVVLEGIVESTGMTTQARTSYLPHEILWGHRFERLVRYRREDGLYLVDYARFHHTVPLDCEVSRDSAHVQTLARSSRSNSNCTTTNMQTGNGNVDENVGGGTASGFLRRNRSAVSTNVEDVDRGNEFTVAAGAGCTADVAPNDFDDDDDDRSSRSVSPATAATRTLQLAVGAPPSVQRSITPVVGRRRRNTGAVLQELSLAAFDLTDECSLSSVGAGGSGSVQAPTAVEQQQQQQSLRPQLADRYHPSTAAAAFTRGFSGGPIGLSPSTFDLQR